MSTLNKHRLASLTSFFVECKYYLTRFIVENVLSVCADDTASVVTNCTNEPSQEIQTALYIDIRSVKTSLLFSHVLFKITSSARNPGALTFNTIVARIILY